MTAAATTDFHIRNRAGVTIATATDDDLARKAIAALHKRWGWTGLYAVKVTVTVAESTVFRQRAREVSRAAA